MALTKVTYSMIKGAVFNVLDYGADATGATDSTTALQAALNAAANNSVYIPAGTYLISTSLLIEDTVTVFGEGISSVITYKNYPAQASGNPSLWSPAIEVRGANNVVIDSLAFTATDRNAAEEANYACAIFVSETSNDFVAQNNFVTNMYSGILVGSGSGVSMRPVIYNNLFTNVSPLLAGTNNSNSVLVVSKTQDALIQDNVLNNVNAPNYVGYQIQTYASTYARITGNKISNPAYGSIGAGYSSTCIVVERTGEGDCNGTIVSNNQTVSGETGIYIFDANNVIVENNYCANHGNGHGIFAKSYGTYTPVLQGIVITNNRVIGAGAAGGSEGNCIQINEVINPIVTGNNVSGMYTGINFAGCDQIVCDGNTVNGYVNAYTAGTKFMVGGISVANNKFVISNNNIQAINGNAIYVYESAQGSLDGNSIYGCNADGIKIDVASGGIITTQPYATDVSNNRIDSCGGWGINVATQNRCGAYTGNAIVNNTNGGIYIDDSPYDDLFTITGNTISQNDGPGIKTYAGNCIISNNNLWLNDSLAAGTTANIYVGPNLTYVIITGNIAGGNNASVSPPPGPAYAVYLDTGDDYIIVKDNSLNQTSVGTIGGAGAAGANNIIADNLV